MNWNGKQVLVTGAGGFIGSHLVERLVAAGASVRAFVHYNALGRAGWLDLSPVRGDIEIVSGDVCDWDSVRKAMHGVEIVFHLAALIAIPYSYEVPSAYVRTNIHGTLHVLQAAHELGVERLIHTSTSEVYGTARYVPMDENHPLQGQSPYSASKIGADKLAEAFYYSYRIPVVIVRPFNTFGPRQSLRAIVPTIIAQCLTNGAVRLGNLYPTRDLNYVDDIARGFLKAAESPEAIGKTINLGSGKEVKISELVQLIAGFVGRNIRIESDVQRVRPKESEVERLQADNTLARQILGWQPSSDSLEKGLHLTIDWIKSHLEEYRLHAYTI
ncbi:MAG: NAD-dependent dehydratase [Omnitrophica bacterium RIFCSPLOWO2_12_FULL_50_11]|nr:MAG: NAD-dependent dehydratase [Omnitrophica bacterium RIFCSPLOWO2_12_FULL_50_11]